MKNKNILLLLAVTLVVAVGLVFFLKPDQATASAQNINPDKSYSKTSVPNGEYARKDLKLSSADLAKAKTETVLFHEIQDEDLKNSEALPLAKSGKGMMISYNQNIIETKNVGDTVKFQMLEYGVNREGKIVEIEKVMMIFCVGAVNLIKEALREIILRLRRVKKINIRLFKYIAIKAITLRK